MAYRWRIIAVTVADAQESGTGMYEPFAVGTDEDVGEVILCKQLIEDEDDEKASEVQGGLGEDW